MTTCDMQSLVEARRDGRLGDKESASVTRHLNGCRSCRAFVADLDTLAELGTRAGEAPPVGELEHRRNRLALLRAAAAPKQQAQRQPRSVPAFALAAAAMLALVIGLVGMWDGSGLAAVSMGLPAVDIATPPAIEATITASAAARFERKTTAMMQRVRLYDGTLILHVVPLAQGQRFIVAMGDAEVEVRGTRFLVRAEDDALRSVSVEEGVVEVRHAGTVRLLHAGDAYDAPRKTALLVEEEKPPSNVGPRRARQPLPRPDIPSEPAAEAGAAADAEADSEADSEADTQEPSEAGQPAPRPASAASRAFADAIGKIEKGNYREASKALRAFERDHDDDARREDAAFLAIVALQRAGRHAAAAAAARHYLATYPDGARRAEAEAVARRGK